MRVLVVDDNTDAAESTAMVVTLWGHETRTAYDGAEAIQAALEFRPDAILLDIGLPGLSGWDVARALREEHGMRQVRLVAVTGYGAEADRRRSCEAGIDAHLTKPVDLPTLKTLLAPAEDAP
jgi:CheY-like chemotaxis protein